jgi:hypothetical protein
MLPIRDVVVCFHCLRFCDSPLYQSHADRYISMLESRFDAHISDSRDTCEAAGDTSHRSVTGPPTKVARGKRRRDDERA